MGWIVLQNVQFVRVREREVFANKQPIPAEQSNPGKQCAQAPAATDASMRGPALGQLHAFAPAATAGLQESLCWGSLACTHLCSHAATAALKGKCLERGAGPARAHQCRPMPCLQTHRRELGPCSEHPRHPALARGGAVGVGGDGRPRTCTPRCPIPMESKPCNQLLLSSSQALHSRRRECTTQGGPSVLILCTPPRPSLTCPWALIRRLPRTSCRHAFIHKSAHLPPASARFTVLAEGVRGLAAR